MFIISYPCIGRDPRRVKIVNISTRFVNNGCTFSESGEQNS